LKPDVVMYKYLEKRWSIGSFKKQQNYMKIAHSVWMSLYMRDNEKVLHSSCPLAPACGVLNAQHLRSEPVSFNKEEFLFIYCWFDFW
jgi:hypothetical protein